MRDEHQQTEATSLNSDLEKRVFSRVDCYVDLDLESPVGTERVEAVDLSLLGLGFERTQTQPELQAGSTLTLCMHGLRPVAAKVRWQHGARVGVQFCGRFHDIVDSWVGEVLAAQGVTIRDVFCFN